MFADAADVDQISIDWIRFFAVWAICQSYNGSYRIQKEQELEFLNTSIDIEKVLTRQLQLRSIFFTWHALGLLNEHTVWIVWYTKDIIAKCFVFCVQIYLCCSLLFMTEWMRHQTYKKLELKSMGIAWFCPYMSLNISLILYHLKWRSQKIQYKWKGDMNSYMTSFFVFICVSNTKYIVCINI